MQLAKTVGDQADMRLCGVQRASAEVGGQADTIDDVATGRRPARRAGNEARVIGCTIVPAASQMRTSDAADEAAGAEHRES